MGGGQLVTPCGCAVAGRDAARYGASVRHVPYGEISGLLVDLGNTLVGMDPGFVADALCAEGVDCSAERFARAEAAARPALSAWIASAASNEPTTLVYAREILRQLALDADACTAVAPRVIARFRQVPTQRLWSAVLPGIPDALARARGLGLRVVVVSNSDGTAESGVVACGLRPFVDAVVDSHLFGVEKPDRRIFAHALELAGIEPGRAVHVGDLHAVDVVGAAGAGIHPILLDPFGDWPDMDCAVAPDVGTIVDRIASARG
jgi:HAD superfamily hydrolase (TIGR01549 family)